MLATTWSDRLDAILVGPMWPATVLAILFLIYAAVSLLGLVDFGVDADLDVPDLDAPDLGLDASGEPMASDWFGGTGAATLRAMNLDRVPLVIWLSVFSVLFWVISYFLWFGYDLKRYEPTFLTSGLLTIRNGVLGIFGTKALTWPIHHVLRPPTEYHAGELIGGTAVIETRQADATFGRARFATDAAPLLISVQTAGEIIAKGERVVVLNYDPKTQIYQVELESARPETQSDSPVVL